MLVEIILVTDIQLFVNSYNINFKYNSHPAIRLKNIINEKTSCFIKYTNIQAHLYYVYDSEASFRK